MKNRAYILLISWTLLIAIATHIFTKYYVRKVELTTRDYNISENSDVLTHDTMSIYTYNNIYHVDFKNLMILNEMNQQKLLFDSYTSLFDYVGDITANETNYDTLVKWIVSNSWIESDSTNDLFLKTKFSETSHIVYKNKFGLYNRSSDILTYLPE